MADRGESSGSSVQMIISRRFTGQANDLFSVDGSSVDGSSVDGRLEEHPLVVADTRVMWRVMWQVKGRDVLMFRCAVGECIGADLCH